MPPLLPRLSVKRNERKHAYEKNLERGEILIEPSKFLILLGEQIAAIVSRMQK